LLFGVVAGGGGYVSFLVVGIFVLVVVAVFVVVVTVCGADAVDDCDVSRC